MESAVDRVSVFIDGSNLYHGLKGEFVRDLGKHVEVACFRRAYHVKQVADRIVELNRAFLAPLWLKR